MGTHITGEKYAQAADHLAARRFATGTGHVMAKNRMKPFEAVQSGLNGTGGS